MPLLGQASGGFTESSSALRILHVGIRNTIGVLTADSFTSVNPINSAAAARNSSQCDTTKLGVLSGAVCIARPDEGSNYVGGVTAVASKVQGMYPLGVFINSANGNSFENTPGTASGKGPYVSAQGCYANSLYETSQQNATTALTYAVGDCLGTSPNGFLTNAQAGHASESWECHAGGTVLVFGVGINTAVPADYTIIGIVKMPPDSTQNELVYDQRI